MVQRVPHPATQFINFGWILAPSTIVVKARMMIACFKHMLISNSTIHSIVLTHVSVSLLRTNSFGEMTECTLRIAKHRLLAITEVADNRPNYDHDHKFSTTGLFNPRVNFETPLISSIYAPILKLFCMVITKGG